MDKSFAVENLSYRDDTREDDFLLKRVQTGNNKFYYPKNGPEFTYSVPSVMTQITCTESIEEINADMYTEVEISNMLEDIEMDSLTRVNNKAIVTNNKDTNYIASLEIGDNRLIINKVD